MDNFISDHNEPKPGGNIAFGGSIINRDRKIENVDPSLIQAFLVSYDNVINKRKEHNAARKELERVCNRIKDTIPKGKFKKFLKKNFPDINICIRTIQRAMEVDSYFDFEAFPAFLFVSQRYQLKLAHRFKFEKVIAILSDNGINLKVDENDVKKVRKFTGYIKLLADGKMNFLTPTEDDENNKESEGPDGWKVFNGKDKDSTDTRKKVKSTE